MRRAPLVAQRLVGPLGAAQPGLSPACDSARRDRPTSASSGSAATYRDGGQQLGEAVPDRGPASSAQPTPAGADRGGAVSTVEVASHDELGVRHVDVERVHRVPQ